MILFFLLRSYVYTLNINLIYSLLELVGHCVSRDILKQDCYWLEKNKLVIVRDTDLEMLVITMTQTGEDIATGRQFVPGVRRPLPGEIEKWMKDLYSD